MKTIGPGPVGRPRTRSKEYWQLYLRLKQREFRAKRAGDQDDLNEARRHLNLLKASQIGKPLVVADGMHRRKATSV